MYRLNYSKSFFTMGSESCAIVESRGQQSVAAAAADCLDHALCKRMIQTRKMKEKPKCGYI